MKGGHMSKLNAYVAVLPAGLPTNALLAWLQKNFSTGIGVQRSGSRMYIYVRSTDLIRQLAQARLKRDRSVRYEPSKGKYLVKFWMPYTGGNTKCAACQQLSAFVNITGTLELT